MQPASTTSHPAPCPSDESPAPPCGSGLAGSKRLGRTPASSQAVQDDLAHEGDIGGLAGEELELGHGLVDEHGDAVDGFGAGGLGLFEQQGLGGVVDGVEDGHVGFEDFRRDRARIHLGGHADAGTVDQ